MRRAGKLWERVVAFKNLLAAAWRAARGKRRRESTAAFLDRAEPWVLEIQRELEAGTWRPRPMRTFVLHDPKRRTIAVPAFRDRVVHHALLAVLEPVFERRMVPESFACRRGKGQHAALRAAQGLVRRYAWCLKLDVLHCFESLRHAVVLATAGRTLKDRRVMEVLERIVQAGSPGRPEGVGLPIGSLTSQWLANLVLDRLDHHVKEALRIPGYVRYMDDAVLFAEDKPRLVKALAEVASYLADPLGLVLKPAATRLAPTRTGLPFLGWQVYPRLLRLRPSNRRRTVRRLGERMRQYLAGEIEEAALAASTRSVVAHLSHGNTLGWRRSLFDSSVVP